MPRWSKNGATFCVFRIILTRRPVLIIFFTDEFKNELHKKLELNLLAPIISDASLPCENLSVKTELYNFPFMLARVTSGGFVFDMNIFFAYFFYFCVL